MSRPRRSLRRHLFQVYDLETGTFSTHERPFPITLERLRELIEYDDREGTFFHAKRVTVRSPAGHIVNGRLTITLDSHLYQASHLAWLLCTGDWPLHDVKHIDGDNLNNRFANLKERHPPRA